MLTRELGVLFLLENGVGHGALGAVFLAVANSLAILELAVLEVVELVVDGGALFSLEGGDVQLGALLLAEVGVGHVGNHIPVAGKLRNKNYDDYIYIYILDSAIAI
jgi:hypothetical protein